MNPRTAKNIIRDYKKMDFSDFANTYCHFGIRNLTSAEKLYEKAKEVLEKNKWVI